MKKLFLLLFLLIPSLALAQTGDVGFYTRADCTTLNPVNNQTLCLQGTTTSGLTAGVVYVYTAGVWTSTSSIGTGDLTEVQGTTSEITITSGTGPVPVIAIADSFRIGGHTATAPVKIGTAPPGTCTVGDLFFDSNETAGSNLYGCTATNTWTLEGGVTTAAASVTFTPNGSIAAVNVQTAIQEVRDEAQPLDADLTALAANATAGFWAAATNIVRSLGDNTNQILWTNPAGVAGNPVARLANCILDGSCSFAIDSGSTDAYAACPESISAMSGGPAINHGSFHSFQPNTDNTGSAFLSLCGTAQRQIVKVTSAGISTALITGDLKAGQAAIVTANNNNSTYQLQTPSGNPPVLGVSAFNQRTFQDHANVLTWTNGDGIAGNPTPRVANAVVTGASHWAADAESSDAYAACPESISTMSTPAYLNNAMQGFVANTANTDAATINYCTLGAKPLVKLVGGLNVPLVTGDILVNWPVWTRYNSAADNFQVIGPLASTAGAGTPGGSTTQVQFNSAGAFAGDADFTFDTATNRATATGGFTAGDCTSNCIDTAIGGGVSGNRVWTYARNAAADFAGTTGALPDGNATKFDSAGLIIDGGPRVKTCVIDNDMQSATPLANGNITGNCPFDVAGTLTEIAVFADADVPSALLERWRPNGGAVADLTSAPLATAGSGAYACSKSTAVAGIAGITCTNTLTNTSISAGDVIRVKSATAGGVATRLTIKATVTY